MGQSEFWKIYEESIDDRYLNGSQIDEDAKGQGYLANRNLPISDFIAIKILLIIELAINA